MGNKMILVIGRHAEMMKHVTKLLAENGYETLTCLTNDEAFQYIQKQNIDAIVIGGGVDETSRKLFHDKFSEIIPLTPIIDAHPSTLLVELNTLFSTD